ncbi:MAG: metallophosphoesterase family protein [Desulfotignum sp.]
MKFAVLSDIHGNLEAFQAVLNAIEHLSIDRVISLGDNIGYGPDSETVASLIRARNIASVLGNHEMAVKKKETLAWFNPMAQKAWGIARSQLSGESLDWIGTLPRFRVLAGTRFVHGVPPDSVFLYLFQLPENKLIQKLALSKESVCFVGHTHELGMISWDGTRLGKEPAPPGTYPLKPDRQYIINAGSVGQPRDGTPGAKFILFDTKTRELKIKSVSYPFETTRKKIIAAGIPGMYADRLAPAGVPPRDGNPSKK